MDLNVHKIVCKLLLKNFEWEKNVFPIERNCTIVHKCFQTYNLYVSRLETLKAIKRFWSIKHGSLGSLMVKGDHWILKSIVDVTSLWLIKALSQLSTYILLDKRKVKNLPSINWVKLAQSIPDRGKLR